MSQFDFKDAACTALGVVPFTTSGESLTTVDKGTFFYTGGIIRSGYTSYFTLVDKEKKWTDLNGYYSANKDTGTFVFVPYSTTPSGNTPATEDITKTDSNYSKLIEELQKEYCFFKIRYSAYLKAFLDAVGGVGSSATPDTQAKLLERLIDLNDKLNAFSQWVDWYSNDRAGVVNARVDKLKELNNQLLGDSATKPIDLDARNSVLNTRKEMVRYTKEKNNAITNQISLWASLNIVAIAIIFHLYRTL